MDLKKNAHHVLGLINGESTLSATEVAAEAYLRLVKYPMDSNRREFAGRKQFFGLAQKAMLHIMMDYQKRKHTKRRGGEFQRVPLEMDELGSSDWEGPRLVQLEQLLGELAISHPDWYHVIHHRFIDGETQTVKQLAQRLGSSERDIYRKTNMGLAWIRRRLEQLET
jgi:hypothetical protein